MRRKGKLSRGVAIVGGGLTKLGLFKDRNCRDFFAETFIEMVESVDKGLDPKDIDAIYIGNYSNDFFVNQSHWGPIISDLLGHVPKPVTRTEAACASSAVAFREGVLAIASGLYDVVLVGGFEQMSRRSTEEVAEGLAMASSPYEVDAGFTFPGVFGTTATAYFAKYGADREEGTVSDVHTGFHECPDRAMPQERRSPAGMERRKRIPSGSDGESSHFVAHAPL